MVLVASSNSVDEVWQTSRPPLVPSFILDWALWMAEETRGFEREQVFPLQVVEQGAPRPLLVIHGTEDRRIAEAQVLELFAAAEPKALWLVDGASHGAIRDPVLDVLAEDVISFLDSAWNEPEMQVALAAALR